MVDKKIRRQGNSHAIYLPLEFLNELGLSAGDTADVSLDTVTKEIIIRNAKTAPLTDDNRFDRLVKDAVDKYLSSRGL